jgi:hypothetical protein
MQQIEGCGCGKITYGGWEDDGADVVGDTWHGDKAKVGGVCQKRLYCPRLSGQFAGNTDLIKIDEGNGPSRRRRWGLGGQTRWTK